MPGTAAIRYTTGPKPKVRRRQSSTHRPSPILSLRFRRPTRPTRPAAINVTVRYPPTLPHKAVMPSTFPAVIPPPRKPKIGPNE